VTAGRAFEWIKILIATAFKMAEIKIFFSNVHLCASINGHFDYTLGFKSRLFLKIFKMFLDFYSSHDIILNWQICGG
jgi:hypothetical protein